MSENKDIKETEKAESIVKKESNVKTVAKAYMQGALIGGVGGAIFALITKRKLIMWSAIGAIGGGFIAYKFSDSVTSTLTKTSFKNYG